MKSFNKKILKVMSILATVCMTAMLGTVPANALSVPHGPKITALTGDMVIISWATDARATGYIEYGPTTSYGSSVKEVRDGLAVVDTRHSVTITGLTPGTTYHYRVCNVEVTSLADSAITLGATRLGTDRNFTTHSTNNAGYSFLFLSDTHGLNYDDPGDTGNPLMTQLLDPNGPLVDQNYSFLVHGGDASSYAYNEDTYYNNLLDLYPEGCYKPLYFAHGNHENRGPYADQVEYLLPTLTGQWYYSFRKGNTAYAVLDQGDAPDGWAGSPGLECSDEYLTEVYAWAQNYFNSSEWTSAPMKIVFFHNPHFNDLDADDYRTQQWVELFNSAGVKLVMSGHIHDPYQLTAPGSGRNFYQLVVGQYNIAQTYINTNHTATVNLYRRGYYSHVWSTLTSFTVQ